MDQSLLGELPREGYGEAYQGSEGGAGDWWGDVEHNSGEGGLQHGPVEQGHVAGVGIQGGLEVGTTEATEK